MKLEKATTGDIILSCVIPGWGLLIGIIALIKRETRRAVTMIAISSILITVIVVLKLLEPRESLEPPRASNSMESQLLSAANEVTRTSPKMIDAETRLDGAVAGPGLVFTYLFTLPNVKASDVQPGTFDSLLAPDIKKSGCSTLQLKPFFENGVLVKYEYRGSDGQRIGAVALDRISCAKP